jgi:hypothetical protein
MNRLPSDPKTMRVEGSMLDMVCKSLGWQGGTIHQVVDEITRLRKAESLLRRCQDKMKFDANSDGGIYAHIENEIWKSKK